MNIISFSGIDGSGKSTLAKRAKDYLSSQGIDARLAQLYKRSVYMRIGSTLGAVSPGMKSAFEKISGSGPKRQRSIFRWLRRILFVFDILIFRIQTVYYSLRKSVLVCDRYFFDTLVHYVYLGVIKKNEIDFYTGIIPAPDISILLTVDSRTAQLRERAHDDIRYYDDKSDIYKDVFQRITTCVLDTKGDEDATWGQIENILKPETDGEFKKILMVSRAVEWPWDEASKNLVRDIVCGIHKYEFHILTAGSGLYLAKRVSKNRIYSGKKPGLLQKMELVFFLLKHKSDYDLYHFCFTPEPETSFLISRIIKKDKSLQSIPYITPNVPDGKLNELVFAKTVIVNSRYTKEMLEKDGLNNINLIYPSVDTDRFSPGIDIERSRRDIGIGSSFNVLWAGKFASNAEGDVLFSIISETCALVNDINFIIAARLDNSRDKSRQDELKRRLHDAGLRERVSFYNKIDDMAVFIARCDILIYPFYGGIRRKIDVPYVVVEAMALGKSIVISDVEPLNEAIRDGSAMAVKGDNPSAFAKAIASLYMDKPLRERVGLRNREVALKYFDLKKNIARFEELYESCLK